MLFRSLGWNADFLEGLAESTGFGALTRGENGNETLITIDTGTGADVVTLGTDDLLGIVQPGTAAITATDGSSITGENITLWIESDADISRAAVSGVTAVWLTDSDDLTITAEQFTSMGGAAAFNVEAASFGAQAELHILISEDTNFSDLIDVENLSRAINLNFIVADGATFTLTAEELHYHVVGGGIAVSDDGADNQVVIMNAGMSFDPFNDTSDIGGGGTLAGGIDSDDITIMRAFDGFLRQIGRAHV